MKKILILSFSLVLLFSNCDNKSPNHVTTIETIPVLSQLIAPDRLYLISSITHVVSVKVEDPQGINDIERVICTIYAVSSAQAVKMDTLVDDGTRGDIIMRDGTYTTTINADFAQGKAGDYRLVVETVDRSNHVSEPLTHELSVIDGVENNPPSLLRIDLPTQWDIEDTTHYLITVNVEDDQGLSDIDSLSLKVFYQMDRQPIFKTELWDNGQQGDILAGDGIYTLSMRVSRFAPFIGKYSFRFQAFDKSKSGSNTLIKVVSVMAHNDPPIISNLVAISNIKRPALIDSTLMTLQVSDPQGLSDIRKVYFNSTKPDGNPASGNPFLLLDDGNSHQSGDKVAGDGIYSIKIYIFSDAQTGAYTFNFEAIDKSDVRSNSIIHTLTVIP